MARFEHFEKVLALTSPRVETPVICRTDVRQM